MEDQNVSLVFVAVLDKLFSWKNQLFLGFFSTSTLQVQSIFRAPFSPFQEYLDFVAGISTCALGHADPDLAAAVGDQMKKIHHVSNLYYIPEQVLTTCSLLPRTRSPLPYPSAGVCYFVLVDFEK